MDNILIKDVKNSWNNCNESTMGFTECIPENVWSSKPFGNRFKSFSWEFACILRTRMCYLKGFETGKLMFGHQDDIPDKSLVESWDKKEIVSKLIILNEEIVNRIENILTEKVADFISWLIQHERIHQGKLILYCSQANLDIPNVFTKTWGESNFTKKI